MSLTDRIFDDGRLLAAVLTAGTLAFCAVVLVLSYAVALPGDLSKIEQLRADSAVVDPTQAEDVIGQVTVWNQTIRENQTLNATWWAGWAIPDEWDAVALIPVPR